ncbi:BspA family leucine-rich repeat surface protein [Robiginitalea sp. M366]|uniref:BspA family leucine-rich repeat surface protein n=1 Tax=Robiginitalea aestuariiviva TaxID=3036903 RepID=UPI00240D846C|nr:BspA family leucine-rich repeat surface protein [Robiginitalea aestuariiviva]MDG1572005.1 BspA family leucine-rich repeat surface protein [Robiginitalea aestuariiviva]
MIKNYGLALLCILPTLLSAQNPFVSTWKTDNPGASADNQITIPTFPDETYNYDIDWGDGSSDSGVTGSITHTYATPGTYQVSISGAFPRIYFNYDGIEANIGDKDKILSVDQWGDIAWTSMESAFNGCSNLDVLAADSPDLSQVTSLFGMFYLCSSLQGTTAFASWDVSNVSRFEAMFRGATLFNQNIGSWNMSGAQNLVCMFCDAINFNQPIGSWDVSGVTNMNSLFQGATNFNQPIGGWNTAQVTRMSNVFARATFFNQPIGGWDVSQVTDMQGMFLGAISFDQPLGTWNTGQVTNMAEMFFDALIFNQDIGNWDVSQVTQMFSMFEGAMDFDQSLGNWDISQVTTMERMFFNNAISGAEYDQTLIGWYQLPNAPQGIVFDGGFSQYCASYLERAKLKYEKGWTITDEGPTAGPCPERPFVTNWKTDNIGGSADNQITIPTAAGETYNYTVDWGDGSSDTNVTGNITHTYATPGTYKVEITGQFPRISFLGSSYADDTTMDNKKLLSVEQWGSQQWTSMDFAFANCTEMQVTALDVPILNNATSLESMFNSCYAMQGTPSFGAWELQHINSIVGIFADCQQFNQDLSAWDVRNVTDMSFAFSGASQFNGDISGWDVSSATDMRVMFQDARAFNQDISGWDVSQVTNMMNMFFGTEAFNQDIGGWDVSLVNNMNGMFAETTAFNQDLSNWDVSLVTDMAYMFYNTSSFDQDLGNWNIGVVLDLTGMFQLAALSTENYDATLTGWAGKTVNNGLVFDAGNSTFCGAYKARQTLIDNFGWTINDGGVAPGCAFVTTWKTDNPGVSGSDQVALPTAPGALYDYRVDWGDGTISNSVTGSITHTYASPGTYQISIIGDFPRTVFEANIVSDGASETITPLGDNLKLLSIDQWGLGNWTSMADAFLGCANVDILAADLPDLSNVTDMSNMFGWCTSFTGNATMADWDVSGVTAMSGMFAHAEVFDQAIGNWDVSAVVSMAEMFREAILFNQNVGNWNTSLVTDTRNMFRGATAFNQNLSGWNTGSIQDMSGMFQEAASFNQPIGGWNVSSVSSMEQMFRGAIAFNQDVGGWNVGSVTSMQGMFQGASAFNQDLSTWDVTQVSTMNSMFREAVSFAGAIEGWDVSGVTDMGYMFEQATSFNGSIGSWNVDAVTGMPFMFAGAVGFDQDLGDWNIGQVADMSSMFSGAGLSRENYDWTLLGWSQLPVLQSAVVFDAGSSQYCEGRDARQALIDTYGWVITDGGEIPLCRTDDDADGVFDYKDVCLTTAPGQVVNANGCDLIAADAFSVYALTPSCVGSSDGSIEVSSNLTGYLLDIRMEGTGAPQEVLDRPSESGHRFENLPTGLYQLTVTIPEILFERSFGVTISEIGTLSGKRTDLDPGKGTATYSVSGSTAYRVEVNGQTREFTFGDNGPQTLTVDNLFGPTEIRILGISDCQGQVADNFYIGNGLEVFPTVAESQVQVYSMGGEILIRLYTPNGQAIKEMRVSHLENEVDLSGLSAGMYILQLEREGKLESVKIIKK